MDWSDAESVESYETCCGSGTSDTETEEDLKSNRELFKPLRIRRLEPPKAPFIDELKALQQRKLHQLKSFGSERAPRQSSVSDVRVRPSENFAIGRSVNHRVGESKKQRPLVTISTWTETRRSEGYEGALSSHRKERVRSGQFDSCGSSPYSAPQKTFKPVGAPLHVLQHMSILKQQSERNEIGMAFI